MGLSAIKDHRLSAAARVLVSGHFAVQAGECVLISADTRTDPELLDAVFGAVCQAGATPLLATLPKLPFQGALADPYLPRAFAAAAAQADVWLDFSFPYMAGSTAHDEAIKAGRVRYGLLALPDGASLARVYGGVDFGALMDFQVALAEYLDARAGAEAHFTCPLGSDARFILQPVKLKRHRVANVPGIHTVPGARASIRNSTACAGASCCRLCSTRSTGPCGVPSRWRSTAASRASRAPARKTRRAWSGRCAARAMASTAISCISRWAFTRRPASRAAISSKTSACREPMPSAWDCLVGAGRRREPSRRRGVRPDLVDRRGGAGPERGLPGTGRAARAA